MQRRVSRSWQNAIIHGIFDGMKTTIDRAGRIVVPKKIREAAELEPGSELEVYFDNGVIQLEPAPAPVKFAKRGHLIVARSAGTIGVLKQTTVNTTLEAVRREPAAPAG